jgi:hypothetical protein
MLLERRARCNVNQIKGQFATLIHNNADMVLERAGYLGIDK